MLVIHPLVDQSFGPLDGPFALAAEPSDAQDEIIAVAIGFARQVAGGISFYNNKTGFADSSLFKSFAAECFAELEMEEPQSAALLRDLVIDCRALGEAIGKDRIWQLHRAILATPPGVRFLD